MDKLFQIVDPTMTPVDCCMCGEEKYLSECCCVLLRLFLRRHDAIPEIKRPLLPERAVENVRCVFLVIYGQMLFPVPS